MEDVIILLLLAGIMCFVWYERKKIKQQEMLLGTLAKNRNGQVRKGGLLTYPKFLLNYKGYDLTVFSTFGDRRTGPFTYYTYANSSLILPRNIRCTIYQGLTNLLDMVFGMQEIQTGNVVFDDTFKIKGTDALFLKSFLTPMVQQQLLCLCKQFGTCRISISSDRFEIRINSILDSLQQYDQFLSVTFLCLEQLEMEMDRTTLRH